MKGKCCSSPRDANRTQALIAASRDAGHHPTISQALCRVAAGVTDRPRRGMRGFGADAKVLMSQDSVQS